MNRMIPEVMNYYDQAVSAMISEKYGLASLATREIRFISEANVDDD